MKKYEKNEKEIDELEKDLDKEESEVSDLKKDIKNKKETIDSLKKKLESYELREAKFNVEIKNLTQKVEINVKEI